MTAPTVLINDGWKRTSLKVGDKVTIYVNPLRKAVVLNDGSQGGLYVGAFFRTARRSVAPTARVLAAPTEGACGAGRLVDGKFTPPCWAVLPFAGPEESRCLASVALEIDSAQGIAEVAPSAGRAVILHQT